jgi:hypothetical protein
VASLERPLERREDETERLHQIIGGLAQANAEQARTIRAIEAPASEEPTEAAETVEEVPERSEPHGAPARRTKPSDGRKASSGWGPARLAAAPPWRVIDD